MQISGAFSKLRQKIGGNLVRGQVLNDLFASNFPTSSKLHCFSFWKCVSAAEVFFVSLRRLRSAPGMPAIFNDSLVLGFLCLRPCGNHGCWGSYPGRILQDLNWLLAGLWPTNSTPCSIHFTNSHYSQIIRQMSYIYTHNSPTNHNKNYYKITIKYTPKTTPYFTIYSFKYRHKLYNSRLCLLWVWIDEDNYSRS